MMGGHVRCTPGSHANGVTMPWVCRIAVWWGQARRVQECQSPSEHRRHEMAVVKTMEHGTHDQERKTGVEESAFFSCSIFETDSERSDSETSDS